MFSEFPHVPAFLGSKILAIFSQAVSHYIHKTLKMRSFVYL